LGPYRYFFEACPPELINKAGSKVLWCRFRVAIQHQNPAENHAPHDPQSGESKPGT
jgi:hypothetical protein